MPRKSLADSGAVTDHLGADMTILTCSVDECERKHSARGLCSTHYVRNKRTGSPTGSLKRTYVCEVAGCENKHYGRNLCQQHYLRWYSFGDANIRLNSDVVNGMRICPGCNQDLPLDDFATDNRRKDGRSIYCKPCANSKSAQWRLDNLERSRESKRNWSSQNPDKTLATRHRRIARERAMFVEDVDRMTLMERDSWTCKLCGLPIDSGLKFPHPLSQSIDHVMPVSKGGEHSYANTQAAHLNCNIRKGATLIT